MRGGRQRCGGGGGAVGGVVAAAAAAVGGGVEMRDGGGVVSDMVREVVASDVWQRRGDEGGVRVRWQWRKWLWWGDRLGRSE
ncbi:hypothetical protein Tco_0506509 [Tanacetum coccineum]